MNTCFAWSLRHVLTLALAGASAISAHAAQVVEWSDGFETSTTGFDVNIEPSRQTGTPLVYVGNPRPPATMANDYHKQIIGPVAPLGDRLLLAGDGQAGLPFPDPTVGIAMLSPNRNFKGSTPNGISGTRVTVEINLYANYQGSGQHYVQGGISIGSAAVNTLGQSAPSHFAVRMVEDTLANGFGNFLQFYDGNTLVENTVAHSAGIGTLLLDLRISDPVDSDPWNGSGSTKIEIYGNGTKLGEFEKTGGGYTNNFITLEASADFNGFGIGISHFDNLTVYAGEDLTPQQIWRQIYFETTANIGDAADDADPDDDGLLNLVEYGTGTDPTAFQPAPLKIAAGALLSVTHQRATAATDVTVTLQESPDMSAGSWIPAGGVDVETGEDDVVKTFSRTVPTGGALRKFLRLNVTKP